MLLTHSHFDHAGSLAYLLRGPTEAPTVFVPAPVVLGVAEYARMSWAMKITDGVPLPKAYERCDLQPSDIVPGRLIESCRNMFMPVAAGCRMPLHAAALHRAQITGAKPSRSGNNNLYVHAVQCFHSVPTCGYVLSEERVKLAPHLVGTPGRELAKLRQQGVDINVRSDVPLFAYLCDTTVEVLTHEPQIELIFACPVIMIECTYVENDKCDEATRRGHSAWPQLRPHIEAHPDTTWVLFHFSLRYSDDELRTFFRTASSDGSRPRNVILWLDSGIDLPDTVAAESTSAPRDESATEQVAAQ